ncbi:MULTISPECIES: hypothetical protein [unclassified Shewanella]|uniref:hypothetical protein n=1 Tax=unclassified Shewanella TaxID=196818 RepID=UPI000C830644|nr:MULTISPECIES: hypothetical protein [unclassified Shewanella]MDO6619668.1 hypothetical protein [Shewanella sp. 6_MG-2023]MDO6640623.1 hypothetical protein [Shewanella sp. 5_MG-2023]MDO6678756.1 hypothetical protein [Shewanella sp. 4_MG-2023]MDO6775772.1 hypothetical protein [Shewanella sp. 3_MG-2023]PMG29157.1 hypothetical protein BCU94_15125 [Shewanella sp. 10N.286.52.C2]
MRIVFAIFFSWVIWGCSHSNSAENGSNQTQLTHQNNTIQCGAIPPPLDMSGVKQNLIKSGEITTDMSEQQQQEIVRRYIAKRNNAFKKCNQRK